MRREQFWGNFMLFLKDYENVSVKCGRIYRRKGLTKILCCTKVLGMKILIENSSEQNIANC